MEIWLKCFDQNRKSNLKGKISLEETILVEFHSYNQEIACQFPRASNYLSISFLFLLPFRLTRLSIPTIRLNRQYLTNKQMRIISLHVLKWAEQNSLFLGSAYDLSFVSWLQRSFYKQTVNFGARTASNRSTLGSTNAILIPEAQAKCYITVQNNGIAFAALADQQYPERVAFMILKKLSQEFAIKFEVSKFVQMEKDEDLKWDKLDEFIKKYQDPKEVDKLEKLKDELKQVEEICHKNLNDLLKRGEDLDKLMEKSKDVSNLSLDFYKQAKKANTRCCSLS